jgi:cell division protease FtsH
MGHVSYGDNGQEVFLGHSVTQNKSVSEDTAREIDNEVRAFIDHAYAEAKRILTERRSDLESLAKGLLEYETLSGDEIQQVLRGEKIIRKVVDEPMQDNRRASVPTASARPDMPGGLGPVPA